MNHANFSVSAARPSREGVCREGWRRRLGVRGSQRWSRREAESSSSRGLAQRGAVSWERVCRQGEKAALTVIGADRAILRDFNVSTRFWWVLWRRFLPAPARRLNFPVSAAKPSREGVCRGDWRRKTRVRGSQRWSRREAELWSSRGLTQRGAVSWERVCRQEKKAAPTPAAPDLAIGGDFDCSKPATVIDGDGHTLDLPSR